MFRRSIRYRVNHSQSRKSPNHRYRNIWEDYGTGNRLGRYDHKISESIDLESLDSDETAIFHCIGVAVKKNCPYPGTMPPEQEIVNQLMEGLKKPVLSIGGKLF